MSEKQSMCINCGIELPKAGVKVCFSCQKYQLSWKNNLLYWSNVTAIIFLVSGVISFLFSQYRNHLSENTPKLRISKIDYEFGNNDGRDIVILYNGHKEPIFIESLVLRSEDCSLPSFDINELINGNSMFVLTELNIESNRSGSQEWRFPEDSAAGAIKTENTNWSSDFHKARSEKWPNGEAKVVSADIKYVHGNRIFVSSRDVWQGFSLGSAKTTRIYKSREPVTRKGMSSCF